jgi:hypothetical protein
MVNRRQGAGPLELAIASRSFFQKLRACCGGRKAVVAAPGVALAVNAGRGMVELARQDGIQQALQCWRFRAEAMQIRGLAIHPLADFRANNGEAIKRSVQAGKRTRGGAFDHVICIFMETQKIGLGNRSILPFA